MFDNRKLGKNQQQDSGIKAGQEMPLGQKGKQQQVKRREEAEVGKKRRIGKGCRRCDFEMIDKGIVKDDYQQKKDRFALVEKQHNSKSQQRQQIEKSMQRQLSAAVKVGDSVKDQYRCR